MVKRKYVSPYIKGFLILFCLLFPLIFSVAKAEQSAPNTSTSEIASSIYHGELLAEEISSAVGISISPLLGMAALGGWQWLQTPPQQRPYLAWHKQPQFWVPLLALLILILLKDSVKTAAPVPKQLFIPIDAAETVVNKGGGALGLLVVLSGVMGGQYPEMTALIDGGCQSIVSCLQDFLPAVAQAEIAGNNNTAMTGGSFLTTLQTFLTGAVLSCCFSMVWLVSHAITVLILLSPFAIVDMMLKLARNALLAVLTAATLINPWLGLIISLIIVICAWFACGRAFRFMSFGTIFTFDLLFRSNRKWNGEKEEIAAFAGVGLTKVPQLSYGYLRCIEKNGVQNLEFCWRPWLIMPKRTVQLDEKCEDFEVGIRFFSSIIMHKQDEENSNVSVKNILFRLPPRYRHYESEVAEELQIHDVCDVSFGQSVGDFFRNLKRAQPLGNQEICKTF